MSRIWAIATLVSLLVANPAAAVGLLPVPTLAGAQITASAQEDPVNGWFVYSYSVTNPVGNTGEIWNVKIDVLDSANEIQFSTGGLTLPPRRYGRTTSFHSGRTSLWDGAADWGWTGSRLFTARMRLPTSCRDHHSRALSC